MMFFIVLIAAIMSWPFVKQSVHRAFYDCETECMSIDSTTMTVGGE
jgi:hypothetical protein